MSKRRNRQLPAKVFGPAWERALSAHRGSGPVAERPTVSEAKAAHDTGIPRGVFRTLWTAQAFHRLRSQTSGGDFERRILVEEVEALASLNGEEIAEMLRVADEMLKRSKRQREKEELLLEKIFGARS